MASLKQNIQQAISDFDTIKSAIEESGVAVPYDTNTSRYGDLVRQAVANAAEKNNHVGDGKSITIENGVVMLYGYNPLEVGAQPRISADGTLEWVILPVDDMQAEIKVIQADVKAVKSDLATKADASNVYTKSETDETIATLYKEIAKHHKYAILNKPDTTIVDYRDKEIRIMCAPDTEWKLQNVGPTGDSSMYHIEFRAYAPNDSVVSFKEDMAEVIADQTMHYFENNSFAGIDEYGRKYSTIWLAVAKYDKATDTWAYFGEKSTEHRYIGWYYSVEWFNAAGEKVASDTIRINLSNENCHGGIEPYYMAGVLKGGTADSNVEFATDEEIKQLF